MCPPERPRSGVSMPKIHALCVGNLTTNAPLQGDAGGHTGTAPTTLRNIFPRNSIQTKFRPCAIHPKRNQPSMCNPPLPISIKHCGVPLPIVHSIAHANHAVCPYPIGVILSIAQGWQVQRSLPWVTMQARRLPPWGCTFSITLLFNVLPTQHSGAEMHRALPPPFLK